MAQTGTANLIIADRFRFWKRNQKNDESVNEYAAELKKMSLTCNFGDFLQEALRDKFVSGLKDQNIQREILLKERNFIEALNFAEACVFSVDITDKPKNISEMIGQAIIDVDATINEKTRIDNKLPYADGQWSSVNQSGLKKYQKDFLLALKDVPASKTAPDNIPNKVKAVEKGVHITDNIVGDKPKNISEMIVQAKIDVDATINEKTRIDNKLPYTDGQWSSVNQSGLKKYQKDFLLALKDAPASNTAPDNIPDNVKADKKLMLPSKLSGEFKKNKGNGGKGIITKPIMKVSISRNKEDKLDESGTKVYCNEFLRRSQFGAMPVVDEPMFKQWHDPNTANMYAAMENIECDRRMNIRSGQRNLTSSQRSTCASRFETITKAHRFRRIINCLEEYLSSNCSLEEYFADISCAVPAALFSTIIKDSYLHTLDKTQQIRFKTGGLFAKLILQDKIPLKDYCKGLEELLSQTDDLKIDIPKIWDYLAEILVELILEEALSLKELHKTMNILIERDEADKLLAPLFKLVISKKETNFLQNKWLLSHFELSDFMDPSRVSAFILHNQFEFLLDGTTPIVLNQSSYENIEQKILNFLRTNRSFDDIRNWVSVNVGDEGVKEKKFVRALATAIFEDSINKNHKMAPERLEQHSNLLLKYVDNNLDFQLECLYALQALIHQMDHPRGTLLQICDKLYELETFSPESFIAWEQSSDPTEQEGKGIALKMLTSFFCQLKEDNVDDESWSSEPDLED